MESMLCEKCHQREATCHSTAIIDEVAQTSDLCSECFESSASPEASDFLAAARMARCQYCGGHPCAGGSDFFELLTGGQQMSFMCIPCSQEFLRYTQQELDRLPHGLSQQEQIAALRKLREQAETHMKDWVSGRDTE